ncbi:hypothetical protein [Legionella impletisoli]|uniref:Uncharacterized protein n=1 Tax=Legionella impletisoli TaxID=343510 RepID=A0A917NFH7_9GAMM|nr:hypothetical protein [Legionella impletisoli]GGI92892.1 hypothetical protein GCM10007966_21870 [Legionella impletisoli]
MHDFCGAKQMLSRKKSETFCTGSIQNKSARYQQKLDFSDIELTLNIQPKKIITLLKGFE